MISNQSSVYVLNMASSLILQESLIGPNNFTHMNIQNCDPNFDIPDQFNTIEQIFLSLTLGMLIGIMIIGNILVIIAIIVEKDLQRPQYFLVCSLALADLMVGVVVSPLAALYEVHRQWHLGVGLCDFWILSDVLACTASILHLVAIALDRYWSITDVGYMRKRTTRRIGWMILVVWAISVCVSMAPMLGWKDDQFQCRVEINYECLISQDPAYQIFSTTTAFYGPLVFICILYWKIYIAAKTRIRMQVKRRSNPRVAQIRAKIQASEQQQQEQQTALPSGRSERHRDHLPQYAHSPLGNGHGFNNGKEDLHGQNRKISPNVEICLTQPTVVEASCADMDSDTQNDATDATSIAGSSPQNLQLPNSYSGIGEGLTGPKISTGACADHCPTEDTADCPTLLPRVNELRNSGSSSFRVSSSRAQCKVSSASLKTLTPKISVYSNLSQSEFTSTTLASTPTPSVSTVTNVSTRQPEKKRSRLSRKKEAAAESRREKRAGRTLAIITGIFVISWLPFFILALIRPLCPSDCYIPTVLNSICVWLGYANSAINPVVYTIFSPDVRNAFKRILRRLWIIRRV